MSTFTWVPDRNPSGNVSFRVKEAQFGDGYKQSSPDGINHRVESWPLSFTDDSTTIGTIKAFLDARGGFDPFTWTNPLGVSGRYLASQYSITSLGSGVQRLTVTFEQDFTP